MAARPSLRHPVALPALLLVLGCADPFADDGDTGCDDAQHGGDTPIAVSGDAFAFTLPGTPYGRIEGASISIVEQPGLTAVTDAGGHFVITGVPAGSTATFEMVADGFPRARTKTFTLPAEGPQDRVTFQIPDDALFALLADLLTVEVDPEACQIVTTVTRVGRSVYDDGAHGEAGATVTLDPPVDAAHGPVYFGADVVPDPSLTQTTEDGGVLYSNVPAGTYVMRAMKDGVTFDELTMECEGGTLVNASPPFGLQAH